MTCWMSLQHQPIRMTTSLLAHPTDAAASDAAAAAADAADAADAVADAGDTMPLHLDTVMPPQRSLS